MRVFDNALLWINAEHLLVFKNSMKRSHHHHFEFEETSSFSFFSELNSWLSQILPILTVGFKVYK